MGIRGHPFRSKRKCSNQMKGKNKRDRKEERPNTSLVQTHMHVQCKLLNLTRTVAGAPSRQKKDIAHIGHQLLHCKPRDALQMTIETPSSLAFTTRTFCVFKSSRSTRTLRRKTGINIAFVLLDITLQSCQVIYCGCAWQRDMLYSV